jgi:hypothetical protein
MTGPHEVHNRTLAHRDLRGGFLPSWRLKCLGGENGEHSEVLLVIVATNNPARQNELFIRRDRGSMHMRRGLLTALLLRK